MICRQKALHHPPSNPPHPAIPKYDDVVNEEYEEGQFITDGIHYKDSILIIRWCQRQKQGINIVVIVDGAPNLVPLTLFQIALQCDRW